MSNNASANLNLSTVVRPKNSKYGRVTMVLPAAIVRELGIIAEWMEYVLEVKEGGILVLTPRARTLPWTIRSSA